MTGTDKKLNIQISPLKKKLVTLFQIHIKTHSLKINMQRSR